MSRIPSKSVSELLEKWPAGDQQALEALLPLLYAELRRLAHHYLRKERRNHTLQSTALVHEAYLRLVKQEPLPFQNRAHFLAVSGRLMREILVEYARRRHATKRDGGYRLTLSGVEPLLQEQAVEVVALDDALQGLDRLDPRQSRVVELRYFGGLTVEETAEVLNISAATVEREWKTAKLWLCHEMRDR